MVNILIQVKVKDFAEWKKVFDSAAGLRTSSGGSTFQVFRDESDPNSITTINKWNSLENAQKKCPFSRAEGSHGESRRNGTTQCLFLERSINTN